jgi:hypothetical protein
MSWFQSLQFQIQLLHRYAAVRSRDRNLVACVSFHMLADGTVEVATAPSINGPGYVIYGKYPHFPHQPPTGTYQAGALQSRIVYLTSRS